MQNDLIIVTGAYGSGKSEYAINLAQKSKQIQNKIVLVDLDVVNPYFRSRDVKEYFSGLGLEVISPEGEYGHADLPMISPRISGTIRDRSKSVILDVGGDPAGCRTLGRFVEDIEKRGYEMHFVVNTLRPFTSNPSEILEMMQMLQYASKLKITEIIANINLLNETTNEMVRSGLEVVEEAAKKSNVRFTTYLVIEDNDQQIDDILLGKKKQLLKYYLSKPWDRVRQLGI